MSTQQPSGAAAELPELDDRRIDEIDQALFADIARDRDAARTRSARRGRRWLAGGAAAAVIVVAAILAPSIVPLVSPVNEAGGSSDSAIEPGIAPDAPVTESDGGGAVTGDDLRDATDGGAMLAEDVEDAVDERADAAAAGADHAQKSVLAGMPRQAVAAPALQECHDIDIPLERLLEEGEETCRLRPPLRGVAARATGHQVIARSGRRRA